MKHQLQQIYTKVFKDSEIKLIPTEFYYCKNCRQYFKQDSEGNLEVLSPKLQEIIYQKIDSEHVIDQTTVQVLETIETLCLTGETVLKLVKKFLIELANSKTLKRIQQQIEKNLTDKYESLPYDIDFKLECDFDNNVLLRCNNALTYLILTDLYEKVKILSLTLKEVVFEYSKLVFKATVENGRIDVEPLI